MKKFEAQAAIRKPGGTYQWQRIGSAYEWDDGSIYVYLDALPKEGRFRLQVLTNSNSREVEE